MAGTTTGQTTNSPNNTLNPQLNSYFEFYAKQQLLAGFGLGPNLRFLRIARTNQKVSDIAFRAQLISTVTQICDLYWDLVSAYDNEQVGERSVAFATETLDTSRKQLELQAIPEMDVLKAEAELATRQQDLTVARTNLELQELYMKNAITRSLDDPVLQEMPVVPVDHIGARSSRILEPVQEMIADALKNRTELQESSLDLQNSELSRKTARNALLPSLSVYGFYAGTGYAGTANPLDSTGDQCAGGLSGAVDNAFNYSSPEYQVGFQLNVPLRNRIAKADQYRTELEYRQSQVYLEELKKRIRIEVRNARLLWSRGPAAWMRRARPATWRRGRSISCSRSRNWARDRISRRFQPSTIWPWPSPRWWPRRPITKRRASKCGAPPAPCLRSTASRLPMQKPASWRRTIPAKQERIRVLVADDQPHILEAVELLLAPHGIDVDCVRSPQLLMEALGQRDYDVLLIDLNYTRDTTSGQEGLDLLARIQEYDSRLPVIVMTAWGNIGLAVESIKRGARDFIQKPWENERLLSLIRVHAELRQALRRARQLELENRLLRAEGMPEFIAAAPSMQPVLELIAQVGPSDANVLITGEHGTGKEIVARLLHAASPRARMALVAVNAGGLPEGTFESEIFGHVKGAFTDARSDRIGRFELANGGTLFLDEIANVPLRQQAKLLRVLETGELERVGSSQTRRVDVRLLCATNAQLDEEAKAGNFREDLLFRINTVEIHLPALRDRRQTMCEGGGQANATIIERLG